MRRSLIALAAIAVAACNTAMDRRFHVTDFKEDDELGHGREVLDLGIARAVVAGDELLGEGRDKSGQMWTTKAPLITGAIGRNRILAADFDANGERDLLVVTITA